MLYIHLSKVKSITKNLRQTDNQLANKQKKNENMSQFFHCKNSTICKAHSRLPLWKIMNILTSKSGEISYEKYKIWVIDVKISKFCLKISQKLFTQINDPNCDRIRIAISTRVYPNLKLDWAT